MRAGTLTLRIGDRLVGLRADTDSTLRRLRALLAVWIDDGHPDVAWAFDVRLEPGSGSDSDDARRRGVRSVPQLRAGRLLVARSRSADDVLRALAHVLGGVLAGQDTTRSWSGLRPLACQDQVVLVDAQPPALVADAPLARAGIDELPSWIVAVDDATVHVPPPLDDLDWSALGLEAPPTTWRSAELAGLVALDRHIDHDNDDHGHGHHSTATGGDAFSRFAVRQASTAWFSTVERLAQEGRVTMTSDRAFARRRIIDLLTR